MGIKEKFEEKFKVDFEEWQKKMKGVRVEMSRVHPAIAREFEQMCDEEFCSDRGMALKWLMDFRKGLLSSPNEELAAKIDLLAEEVTNLKKLLEAPPKKVKRAASGKKIEFEEE